MTYFEVLQAETRKHIANVSTKEKAMNMCESSNKGLNPKIMDMNWLFFEERPGEMPQAGN